MIENTYAFVLRRRRHTHTDTHRRKKTPGEFQGTSQPGRETSWGRGSAGYLLVGGGVLRGAAPTNGRAARPAVTRVGLVSAEEPERSPRAGIRVVDRIQRETRPRSDVLGRYRNRPDGLLHQRRTAMHHHPQTCEKALSLSILLVHRTQDSSKTPMNAPANAELN